MGRFQRGSLRKEERANGATWVLRFYATRPEDGKRVERTVAVGLVQHLPSESAAWQEVHRQRLLDTVNNGKGNVGRKITFAEIASHYQKYELEDQANVVIPKSHNTVDNYRRNLRKRIVPRWGKRVATGIESLEIEQWLQSLRREGLSNPTCARLKNIMSVVYTHAQRHKLIPLGVQYNPVAPHKEGGAGVRCPVKSDYESISITPLQAYQIWSRLPLMESTLCLLAACTGLRISECLGLKWEDVDFGGQVIKVRRSWSGGQVGKPKTEGSKGTVPCGPELMVHLQTWRENTVYGVDNDWVFPSTRMNGKQPRVANMLVSDWIRPAAVAAGVLKADQKVRFGFHTLRHSLASFIARENQNPAVAQKMLRHSNLSTTLGVYTHVPQQDRLDAQSLFFAAASSEVVN